MKRRVLISAPYMLPVIGDFRPALEAEGIEIIEAQVRERLSATELLPVIENFDGVICGDDEFNEEVLRAATRLKVISKWGTGIDSIDRQTAAKLGIQVFNTPDAFTDAVADTALGYMLCFARRLVSMDREIRRNLWIKPDAFALKECALGIVGLGNIGKAVARRAQAFGMKIYGTDIIPVDATFVEKTGIILTTLDSLLENSDFVSLHCNLNPTSIHLIGRNQLNLMRSTAYLINTSRGAVIDESALAAALKERRIAGAALDVFEVEPLPACSPLRTLDNCLFAPHNANSSLDARDRVHNSTIGNLINGFRAAENFRLPEEPTRP